MSKEIPKDEDALAKLKDEFNKEREICAGANASDYHKKRFADLADQLGRSQPEKAPEKAEEPTVAKVVETTSTNETNETVVSSTAEAET